MQKIWLSLFSIISVFFSQDSAVAEKAVFQTTINAVPQNNPYSTKNHILPGTWMRLETTVKNIGSAPSEAGSLQICYAFPDPLDQTENSVLFETEEVAFPSISPGKQVTLVFAKKHQWPTLFNFIRDDWAMREYQVVERIGGRTQVIGSLSVAFSAYYYEGPQLNKPVEVPAKHMPK